MLLSLVVGLAVCSFGVDFGRVLLVKAELQAGADAAALWAVMRVPNGAASRSAAATSAAENRADGGAIFLDVNQDVELGSWDPAARTFTALAGAEETKANALRVKAQRTASRGNAVPLPFSSAFGIPSMDVRATATATINLNMYGIVGLDYVKMSGNASASYWSTSPSSGTSNWGNIASNGDITLAGSSLIRGHARPGVSKTVIGAEGRVTGSTAPLSSPLDYPVTDSSPYSMTNNDNEQIPSYYVSHSRALNVPQHGTVTIPGGVYYLSTMDISGTVNFSGPAVVYIFNQLKIHGTVTTSGNIPSNLKIYLIPNPNNGVLPSAAMTITSNSNLYAHVYSPVTPAIFGGNGDFYGSLIAKSIDMTGTSAIHYDLAVASNVGKPILVR